MTTPSSNNPLLGKPLARADGRPSYFTIGEVAQQLDVTPRTLRYYEEQGLITSAQRRSGQSRLYDNASIERIKMIVALQNCGFSLADIHTMMVPLVPTLVTPKTPQKPDKPSRYDRWKATQETLYVLSDRLQEKITVLTAIHNEVNDDGRPLCAGPANG
ncbi:MAG: MerR family transcriptional regulator [Vampirovibrionales bacterium]